MNTQLVVDDHLVTGYFERNLRDDVLRGLGVAPGEQKSLPPKWFYDDYGSELFEAITRLEEYYPTEAERTILRTNADDIAVTSAADTLVELGSGAADKTTTLLDAFEATGQLKRFIPFDVSDGILRSSSETLIARYPDMDIHGVVGDFEHHLDKIPGGGTRLIALLGGTVGNFAPSKRKELLRHIVATMAPGDGFLLGTDLVKDHDRLVLAYDDPHGVTAAFNKNVLTVLNRRLGANFDLDGFEHVARFDVENEWMDLRLRSLREQSAFIEELNLTVNFAEGEELQTEISAKFREEKVRDELGAIGLDMVRWMTDPRGDYAVSLSILG